MNYDTIRQIAKTMGLKVKAGKPGGWVSVECPFAPVTHSSGQDRNPSMRVEVAPHRVSRWRCFSCGEGGNLAEVLMTLSGLDAQLPFAELLQIAAHEEEGAGIAAFDPDEPEAPLLVDEDWLAQFQNSWSAGEAAKYLAARSITLGQQMDYGLRYDPKKKRVVFPIRDAAGYLRGAQGRTITPGANPKYLFYEVMPEHVSGHQFWFGENRLDFDLPVVMVEGPIDQISCGRVWPNTAAAMGSAMLRLDKLDRMAAAVAVITFFDAGKAGQKARDRVGDWCRGKRACEHVIPPTEALDPGAMTPAQLKLFLKQPLATFGVAL